MYDIISIRSKNVNIFIGPEGGWGENEIFFFKKNGFLDINLGKNVLRAETAAILSTGIISIIKNSK